MRSKPHTSLAALQWAASYLKEQGITEARLDAELLLAYCIKVDRFQLYLAPGRPLSGSEWDDYQTLVMLRGRRKPLQYILGKQEFMSLELQVTPAVLIPRPDTEILVEAALVWAGTQPRPLRILDLCTGSGAIGISLARYLEGVEVWAGDISPAALKVARSNADRCGVIVNFAQGDLLTPFLGNRFHLVTSNPPYIPSPIIPTLQPELAAEPQLALDGGSDGLDFYRRLAQELHLVLEPGGKIMLEIGWDQGSEVESIFAGAGFCHLELLKDYGQRNRVLVGSGPRIL